MTITTNFTQAQLDALTAAIAQGALTVEYEGRRVTYQSAEAMLRLRDRMLRDMNAGSGTPRPNARPSVFVRD